jgi:hypothetical protein
VSAEAEIDVRIVAQCDGSDRQQNPQFCGADATKRHAEYTSDGRREKDFAGHKQIRHEH